MSDTLLEQIPEDCNQMPRLASTLASCVRWRWEDLDAAMAAQLKILEASGDARIARAPGSQYQLESRLVG